MSENQEYTVTLKDWQFEYLRKMAKKYDLEDESKALRCLVNYACEETDQEQSIFEEIRCLDCG